MLVLTATKRSLFRRAWLLNDRVLRDWHSASSASSKQMIVKADTIARPSIDASFDPIRSMVDWLLDLRVKYRTAHEMKRAWSMSNLFLQQVVNSPAETLRNESMRFLKERERERERERESACSFTYTRSLHTT